MISQLDIDYYSLYKKAEEITKQYNSAIPFPHIVFDDFFSVSNYRKILKAYPSETSDIWKTPSNIHTINKSVTKNGELKVKELLYSPAAKAIFHELNSGSFLTFLEKLTGISGLLPDPHFAEGGFHKTASGGMLDIHADFSHHKRLGLERRVNLILYLNSNWKKTYGGELGLYDQKLNLIQRVAPIANRIIIFNTSEVSFHGHPEPLSCPKNRARKSIALYYYTVPRDDRKIKPILFPTDPSFVPIPSDT